MLTVAFAVTMSQPSVNQFYMNCLANAAVHGRSIMRAVVSAISILSGYFQQRRGKVNTMLAVSADEVCHGLPLLGKIAKILEEFTNCGADTVTFTTTTSTFTFTVTATLTLL